MQTSEAKTFTGSRLVALALIALLVAALVALRLDRDREALAVPAGTVAGDLLLESCVFQAESDSYPADCGTLVVAEDADDPGSPLIALPVLRVRALTDTPQEPLFFLTGGPGESNINFASKFADRYVADRDFVAVGYRGAEGSVRLDCPEVSRVQSHATDILSNAFFGAVADAYGSCADRFAAAGIDVSRYGLVQQVDDMETARVALGYDRINLLSESAGTRTALIYAWRNPDSIHRSVMVGVNPPGAFLLDPDINDEQLERFAALCDADDACSARTDDLQATVQGTIADFPGRWGPLPIKESNLRAATLYGLLETAPSGASSAPMMIDTWLSAAEGDTSGFWFNSVLVDVLFPDLFIAGQRAAAVSIDNSEAPSYFADGPGSSNLAQATTASAWAAGRYVDRWPAAAEGESYQQVRTSEVETLLVNGEVDVMTPPQHARRDLLPHLPNGHEVVLPGFAHTVSFFQQQPEAGTQLVNSFFESGTVDVSRYGPEVIDFSPPATHGMYARVILAALVGAAVVMVLSLLALALRVRTRGRVGRRAAAALRSLFPIVAGLGGWSIAALIVLWTTPGIGVTDALVVAPSVAVPVGLGLYYAWVRRAWAASTRRVGAAAAVTAALAGAWLGFHAGTAELSLATSIIGAVAGGNLALILFDMLRAAHPASPRPPNGASVDQPDREPAVPTPIGMP